MSTQIKYKYPNPVKGIALDSSDVTSLASSPESLSKMGINFPASFIRSHMSAVKQAAMDSGITQPVTTPANGTPVQFLQTILAGTIHVLTTVRKADRLAPVVIVGNWGDEEVVLRTLEHTGTPAQYSDHGGLPLASFNETFEKRQIVRFELGILSTPLADYRSAATGTNPNEEKRAALANAFEILRNDIAFNGYNIGTGKTYGLLNDPMLPAYIAVADGAGGSSLWDDKTTVEIIRDISTAIKALEIQSGGNVDSSSSAITLELPLAFNHNLSKSDGSFTNGKTAKEWMTENYPNITVETVPQYVGANAGENVFYLKAVSVDNSGTDGGESVIQVVPEKLRGTGAVPTAKGGLEEGYTAAYAGSWYKRPYAVVRYTDI